MTQQAIRRPQEFRALLSLCQRGLTKESLAALTTWTIEEAAQFLAELCSIRILKRGALEVYEFCTEQEVQEEILHFLGQGSASMERIEMSLEMETATVLRHVRWLQHRDFVRYQRGKWVRVRSL